MSQVMEDAEIERQLAGLPGWERKDVDGTAAIAATFRFADFAGSLDFVQRVGRLAEEAQHHPDIDIRWDTVTLVLSTHSAGGVTAADFMLAKRIGGGGADAS